MFELNRNYVFSNIEQSILWPAIVAIVVIDVDIHSVVKEDRGHQQFHEFRPSTATGKEFDDDVMLEVLAKRGAKVTVQALLQSSHNHQKQQSVPGSDNEHEQRHGSLC